jgi:hypothetical protein
MAELGRALVVLGVVIVVLGLVLVFFDRVPWIGRLPGDVHVQRGNWTFYFRSARRSCSASCSRWCSG